MSDTETSDLIAKISVGEWILCAGAAWILLVDFTVGNRLQEEYFASVLLIVAPLSLFTLMAVYANASGSSPFNGLYPGTVNAAGIGIVVFAALDLLNGLANEFSDSGEFYEITFYLAAVAVLGGLIQMRQESAA